MHVSDSWSAGNQLRELLVDVSVCVCVWGGYEKCKKSTKSERAMHAKAAGERIVFLYVCSSVPEKCNQLEANATQVRKKRKKKKINV